jgi:hypothetical protein
MPVTICLWLDELETEMIAFLVITFAALVLIGAAVAPTVTTLG